MAIYNTPSDAANTAVRAFLTEVSKFHYKEPLNTGSGKGKKTWQAIKEDFKNACAYCGTDGELQIEHLVMFNREEYGLHHPGNIVPVCSDCNKREKMENKFIPWQQQLKRKATGVSSSVIRERLEQIEGHLRKHHYPSFSPQEQSAIAVVAGTLYKNIKSECERSRALYEKLHTAFVAGDVKHFAQPDPQRQAA